MDISWPASRVLWDSGMTDEEHEREDGERGEDAEPEIDRKDIVAMIIAAFQLFLPLVLALFVVGLLVGLLIHFSG